MSSVYIGNKEKNVLLQIRSKITNIEEIELLDKILKQSESNRIKHNEISRVYKAEKRKTNKYYARSQREMRNK